jgi:hypothetical protein
VDLLGHVGKKGRDEEAPNRGRPGQDAQRYAQAVLLARLSAPLTSASIVMAPLGRRMRDSVRPEGICVDAGALINDIREAFKDVPRPDAASVDPPVPGRCRHSRHRADRGTPRSTISSATAGFLKVGFSASLYLFPAGLRMLEKPAVPPDHAGDRALASPAAPCGGPVAAVSPGERCPAREACFDAD